MIQIYKDRALRESWSGRQKRRIWSHYYHLSHPASLLVICHTPGPWNERVWVGWGGVAGGISLQTSGHSQSALFFKEAPFLPCVHWGAAITISLPSWLQWLATGRECDSNWVISSLTGILHTGNRREKAFLKSGIPLFTLGDTSLELSAFPIFHIKVQYEGMRPTQRGVEHQWHCWHFSIQLFLKSFPVCSYQLHELICSHFSSWDT